MQAWAEVVGGVIVNLVVGDGTPPAGFVPAPPGRRIGDPVAGPVLSDWRTGDPVAGPALPGRSPRLGSRAEDRVYASSGSPE